MKGLGWCVMIVLILAVCRDRPSAHEVSIPELARHLNLVRIPGGEFYRGSREDGSGGQEKVRADGFWMGRHEVTAAEYAAFRADTGSGSAGALRRDRYRPVAHVSHADAEAYCEWISRTHGIRARLPTQTEWEYAARGGIPDARYPWGWSEPDDRRACWRAGGPCAAGRFASNGYGLYDMAGNVFEWCRREHADAMTAPVRGGSWAEKDPRLLRVHHRLDLPLSYRDADVGFRMLVEDTDWSARQMHQQTGPNGR